MTVSIFLAYEEDLIALSKYANEYYELLDDSIEDSKVERVMLFLKEYCLDYEMENNDEI